MANILDQQYRALVVTKQPNRHFHIDIENKQLASLPNEDVLIKVAFSRINYKDIQSCLGNPAITRRFPHTPGLDAVGVVVKSRSKELVAGDRVVVVCSPMGMNSPGGFGQFVCVPSCWVTKLPDTMSLEHAMAYGTAGFTAALAINEIEKQSLDKERGVLVTGATGGVGSIAICLLKHLGYRVIASYSDTDAKEWLESMGVDVFIERDALITETAPNLLKQRWGAAIDIAGGTVLSNILKQTDDGGVVIALGLMASTQFSTNILPFILRGVSLIGINAESTLQNERSKLWQKLAVDWCPKNLNNTFQTIGLDELPKMIELMQTAKPMGSIVVKLDKPYE